MPFESLSRDRLRRRAARWHDATMSGRTLCLPPGRGAPPDLALPGAVRLAIAGSETGAILFWSLAESHLVLPPFPVERAIELAGWHGGPLQSLLDRPRWTAVLLLRLGGFAAGVFEGERLAASKVGAPFVKGRHRKGGSSSARFARRREGQARVLFDKACETLREVAEPYRPRLDHLVLGGDRLTLQAFEKRCPYLSALARIRQSRVLNVPDPRVRVLEAAGRLLYTSEVLTFTPPSSPVLS
jgi:hypothetical protein